MHDACAVEDVKMGCFGSQSPGAWDVFSCGAECGAYANCRVNFGKTEGEIKISN
jgi:hypothetical protein